jgi:hypothetical protein
VNATLRRWSATALGVGLFAILALTLVLSRGGAVLGPGAGTGLTAIYLDSQQNDVQGYRHTVFVAPSATYAFSASVNSAKQIKIRAASSVSPLSDWSVSFGGPSKTLVTTGTYVDVRSDTSQGRAYFSVSGQNTYCSSGAVGKFTITELEMPDLQTVTRFAASYEYFCIGGTSALEGEVRFNATQADLSAVTLNVETATFAAVGERQTFTISNVGTTPQTLGVALAGAFPEAFSVTANTCGLVAAGGTCQVEVAYGQKGTSPRPAELMVTDQTARGLRWVDLTGQP